MRSVRLSRLVAIVCSLAGLLGAGIAQAAFTIAPLGSVLRVATPTEQVQEVYTVTNSGKSDLSVEINVLDWAQNEVGLSLYKESSDYLVYPRLLNIKAGDQRTVRIMRKADAAPVTTQTYYRVQIRELAKKLELAAVDGSQVIITTRVLVPLIVQPESFAGQADLQFRQGADGLHIENKGAAIAKLSELFCGTERVAGLTYVQPGISFRLPDVSRCAQVTASREGAEPAHYDVVH